MILPFSTQLNGKPTYFVERIHYGLIQKLGVLVTNKSADFSYQIYFECLPKLHTIREDLKERWKVGTNIDFFINVRQKNMFRFAPVLPVVSTQKIEFIWKDNIECLSYLGKIFNKVCTIKIEDRFYGDAYIFDGKVISMSFNIARFANNDGFDTAEDFFAYFNNDFKGKIIHWTDCRY